MARPLRIDPRRPIGAAPWVRYQKETDMRITCASRGAWASPRGPRGAGARAPLPPPGPHHAASAQGACQRCAASPLPPEYPTGWVGVGARIGMVHPAPRRTPRGYASERRQRAPPHMGAMGVAPPWGPARSAPTAQRRKRAPQRNARTCQKPARARGHHSGRMRGAIVPRAARVGSARCTRSRIARIWGRRVGCAHGTRTHGALSDRPPGAIGRPPEANPIPWGCSIRPTYAARPV